jgi:hypothetical protein
MLHRRTFFVRMIVFTQEAVAFVVVGQPLFVRKCKILSFPYIFIPGLFFFLPHQWNKSNS